MLGRVNWSLVLGLLIVFSGLAPAQRRQPRPRPASDETFGPVMQAYLGYLRNEQEVVDDRVSRHEIDAAYYRRNSNRIRALRQMAVHIVRQSGNDYVPELEAVTRDELRTLFENPPQPDTLRVNDLLANTFRFLGVVRANERFYVFARLDPYEQADLMANGAQTPVSAPAAQSGSKETQKTRPRRANPP
jgi:hypothetical protein